MRCLDLTLVTALEAVVWWKCSEGNMASYYKVEVITGFPNKAGFADRGRLANFRIHGTLVIKNHQKSQFQDSESHSSNACPSSHLRDLLRL